MKKLFLIFIDSLNASKMIWLLCLFFIGTGTSLLAQQDHYYYYGSEKKTLELNQDFFYLSVSSEIKSASQLSKAIGGEFEVLTFNEDLTTNSLKVGSGRDNSETNYSAEVKLNSTMVGADYLDFSEALKSRDFIQWSSPYFKDSFGNRIGVSQYFYVKLKHEKDFKLLQAYASDNNASIVGQNKFMPLWYTLKCQENAIGTTFATANAFYESGLFTHSEPAMMVDDIALCANDPDFTDQWGWNNTGQNGGTSGIDVNACAAWEISQGSRDIVVAVLDHGFEMNHPDLQGNTFGTGYDTHTSTSPSVVRGSHGTACAGIVGAVQNNNTGVSGIAPSLQLMSISNTLSTLTVTIATLQAQLADGINWAYLNGADVISNSWGHATALNSSLIDNAITDAIALGRGGLGTVVVFATGNSNNAVAYPANSNFDIVAVGAMSPCAERKSFTSCDGESWGSCFGTELDVVAPGVFIPTTDLQGAAGYDPSDYAPAFNGTSSATPAVAGIAGLILSINPCLTHDEVEDMLESTAQKVGGYGYSTTAGRTNGTWDNEMGYGLVDAHAAVIAAQLSLTGGSNFDLIVKDRPFDTGLEPNPDTGPMWISEDIWVRQSLDGGTTHENPEYKLYSPNGLYVRVTNTGSATSPCANLAVYFTKASTGLVWANHWDNYNISGVEYGDLINTVAIPEIPPSGTYVAEIPWYPPNPADFTTDVHHFCLLARILSPGDPMYFELMGINVSPNVRNNNNIAWKNVSVYNMDITNSPVSVFVRAVRPELNWVNIRFFDRGFNEDIDYPFFDREGRIKMRVDPELFERILQADMQEIEILADNTLLIQSREARINNLMLYEGENFAVDFNFAIPNIQDGEDVIFDFVQQNTETRRFEGGERFIIQGGNGDDPHWRNASNENKFSFAYPNPTNGNVYVDYEVSTPNTAVEISIQSLRGDLVNQINLGKVSSGKFTADIDVSNLVPGIYFVRLQVGDQLMTQKLIVGINK